MARAGLPPLAWREGAPLLPKGLRIIRFDKRGHGLSDCPPAPYTMGSLVRDAERLLDMLEVRDALWVGLSIGGLIGQGLAAKRLDMIRAMDYVQRYFLCVLCLALVSVTSRLL